MKYFFGVICLWVLIACIQISSTPTTTISPVLAQTTQSNYLAPRFLGQIVYIPVYSHLYHENNQRPFNLAATLSIRNTDLAKETSIDSVRYYNTKGELVKQHLNSPVKLNALASTEFLVERRDVSGGSGANFIVEWSAREPVSEPIMESIMIAVGTSQGISFVSVGKPIKSY